MCGRGTSSLLPLTSSGSTLSRCSAAAACVGVTALRSARRRAVSASLYQGRPSACTSCANESAKRHATARRAGGRGGGGRECTGPDARVQHYICMHAHLNAKLRSPLTSSSIRAASPYTFRARAKSPSCCAQKPISRSTAARLWSFPVSHPFASARTEHCRSRRPPLGAPRGDQRRARPPRRCREPNRLAQLVSASWTAELKAASACPAAASALPSLFAIEEEVCRRRRGDIPLVQSAKVG